MKKQYAKSLKTYKKTSLLEPEKILEAMKKIKDSPKKPTSIALDESTIEELKIIAEKNGIPYQVLMRALILDGIERLKKAA